jgi:hypothetical protein
MAGASRDAAFGVGRRVLVLAVLLSLLPQTVSPAIAARQTSLKWIADWLAVRAAATGSVDGAGVDTGDRHSELDADFLAAVFASFALGPRGSADADVLARELGARVIRVEAPPAVPPSLLGISAASISKWMPQRTYAVVDNSSRLPVAAAALQVISPTSFDTPTGSLRGSPAYPRGP